MPNIVPGALWKPIDVGNRAARRKGRGLIGHIAVVNSTLLIPGPLATRPSDWHFYLPKNPYPTGERFAQLIDLDLQCWSSADANATCAAFESEGGVGTDVNGLWTDNQIEAAAIILAHMHRTEGVPLQDMVNSLPTSRGFGVHRYGIDPYRVPGGELWSKVYAKACPGDSRFEADPPDRGARPADRERRRRRELCPVAQGRPGLLPVNDMRDSILLPTLAEVVRRGLRLRQRTTATTPTT
jgi:hypothetical protein